MMCDDTMRHDFQSSFTLFQISYQSRLRFSFINYIGQQNGWDSLWQNHISPICFICICLKVTQKNKMFCFGFFFIAGTIMICTQNPWWPHKQSALFKQLIWFTNLPNACCPCGKPAFFSPPGSLVVEWLSSHAARKQSHSSYSASSMHE